MERCAQWITFPGNSCQIHQSRAEDTRAGPARPSPDTRLIGVDGRGGGRGLDCLPASNARLKGFDGWPHWATWRGSQHPGSLLFNTLLISFIPFNADSMHSSAEHTGPTVARTLPLSTCQSPAQHLSMVHRWAWQGMQTPWRGISTTPIVWGHSGAEFGCKSIQWLYFYSLALDRDAQWPRFCSAAVSECVHVMPPAEALIISVDMTRKGAMVDSVIAVCCLTCRLGCF